MKVMVCALVMALTGLASAVTDAEKGVWQPSAGHRQIPIWPGAAPDPLPVSGPEYITNVTTSARPWLAACNISQPTMTICSPKGANTGVAVVVFPGGGYNCLAIDLEGTEICDWLTSRGITAVLLKYRVPTRGKDAYAESPQALEDAQRTLGLVRLHATEWHIDPNKVGVIGFSAGGHMVAATSTHFNKRRYRPVDAADKLSCRPDFAIALYPGHLWDDDGGLALNPNVPVSASTPPTFLVAAENDPTDNINNTLAYYMALKNARVPVEMHLYAEGGHAFGLRDKTSPIGEWPLLVEKWLKTIKMVQE